MNFLKYLKRHPFPVVAHFQSVVAVSFAFPESLLRPMVPNGLEIDSYEGLGFVTVAMVWTKKLRPAGVPAFFGRDFFLAGYRIFTKVRDDSGRRLRGLKIVRSETDKRSMKWLGNLLTGYHYEHVTVRIDQFGAETRVQAFRPNGSSTLDLTFEKAQDAAELPAGSPFPDWKTARLFAGPMPFTFGSEGDGRILVVEGRRESWVPRPVTVKRWEVGLFREAPLRDATPVLANAFTVADIPYRWERGRVIRPGGGA